MRRQVKQQLFRVFLLLDRVGIHLLTKHFYSPIPDYAWLRANKEVWTAPNPLAGLDWTWTASSNG